MSEEIEVQDQAVRSELVPEKTNKPAPLDRVSKIGELIQSKRSDLARALPQHVSVDRLIRCAVTAMRMTPRLAECTPVSVIGALMQAAQLGIEPNDGTGRGWLIPRRNNRRDGVWEASFQLGYLGMIEQLHKSKQVSSVIAETVHEGDYLRFSKGLTPTLDHQPSDDSWDKPITHVYAVITTTSGGTYFDCWPVARIQAHRARYSKLKGDDSVWETNFDWMAKKTVLMQVGKLAPRSVELAGVMQDDGLLDVGEAPTAQLLDTSLVFPEAEQPAKESAVDKLKATLKKGGSGVAAVSD